MSAAFQNGHSQEKARMQKHLLIGYCLAILLVTANRDAIAQTADDVSVDSATFSPQFGLLLTAR